MLHDRVTLSWDDPGDSTITGYMILRRDIVNQPPGTFTTVESNTGTSATTCTDSGAVDAICTGYDRMLFNRIELTVPRPPPRQG